jgi:predicted acetyltransferase
MQIRELTADDADASLLASRDAFGGPLQEPSAFTIGNGVQRWGIFDGRQLAAKANSREYLSVIGGREVSTAGVAGVLVTPEYRGTGLARQLMTHLLSEVRAGGAAISTLFRTAPSLYRSLGYEQVAEVTYAELPAAALRGLRVQPPSTVRRATVEDGPAIRSVYARVAAAGSCLLTRTGPCFAATDQELMDHFDGITLAVDPDGSVSGYVSWNRGENFGAAGMLGVTELHALNGAALESLLAVVGSFEAVTFSVRFRTSGTDPIHWLIPGPGWSVSRVEPYLLRVVDLAAAVAQRGWPAGLTADIPLTVEDPVCPWNGGDHRLVLDCGVARLEPGAPGGYRIGSRGLGVLMAGGVTTARLRHASLIDGGSAADDVALDAAMAGPRPAILDFF